MLACHSNRQANTNRLFKIPFRGSARKIDIFVTLHKTALRAHKTIRNTIEVIDKYINHTNNKYMLQHVLFLLFCNFPLHLDKLFLIFVNWRFFFKMGS